MKKSVYLILSALLVFLAELSAHHSRLAPEGESLALVCGCVNVISGEFVQQETDLFISGPSPLVHRRIYDSGISNASSPIGFGFTRALAGEIVLLETYRKRSTDDEGHAVDGGTSVAMMEEREGVPLIYNGRHNGKSAGEDGQEYTLRASAFAHGYTNYCSGDISGATNLHNVRLLHRNYKKHSKWGEWTVTLGDGAKRLYRHHGKEPYRFQLAEEIRADGNRLIYEYEGCQLTRIYLTNANKSVALIDYRIRFEGDKVLARGSNNQTLCYIKDINHCKVYAEDGIHRRKITRLAYVEGDHLTHTTYSYPSECTPEHFGKIQRIDHPEGRTLGINYFFSGKVSQLVAPTGTDQTLHPIATFGYTRNTCDVTGPHGEWTKYWINGQRRITYIQRFSQQKLDSQTRYFWAAEGIYAGNLLAKALCDPSGNAFSSAYHIYDQRGNIIRETLFGNLTGQTPGNYPLDAEGRPNAHVEGYAVERSYLPVFNVVTEERADDGSYTQYRYKEGTNLLVAKLRGRTKCYAREFFSYDEYANRIRHITDDGSGNTVEDLTHVTERLITEIDPIVTPLSPAFGKPEKRREKYWEAGREVPLRTIHYQYDAYGYPIREEIYDAEGNHRYTLQRTFDAAGRILVETDPVGAQTLHAYDANGNRILTVFVQQNIHIQYQYDYSNRLIKETEIHPHKSYETSHRYDLSSRKIATVDPFGNETLYAYDELGRVRTITHPLIEGERGIEKFEYDIAGNKTLMQDVLGGLTSTSYTIRGQPIQITYPDGSQEHYQYNTNGLLAKHTAQNGVTTMIFYDDALKPEKKSLYDASGTHLYDTYAIHQGSKIIKEIDANGIETLHFYDGAGRLIETQKGPQRTQYAYDSLGRQYKTSVWADENNVRITFQEYDLLNRLIEESVEDQIGKIYSRHRYTYDNRGNRCLQLTETSQGFAKTSTEHDSRHRPIRETDALGNITITTYEENSGPLKTTVTDALGHQTIITQNSARWVTKQIRQDNLGQLCACSEFFYDVAGRKIRQQDTSIAPGLAEQVILTEWVYDPMGRIITLTEAVGTPEQKTTRYSYNAKGQKETIYLPDGTLLNHLYDGIGYLKRYTASDQSIDYTYAYDLNGNLLSVCDALTQTSTHRQYDDNNRMISELLANGLSLCYTYDGLNRPLTILLPDGTAVQYAYDACHLKTVSRLSEQPYEHHYTSYDLSGTLLEETSPIGEISYRWDRLNRPRAIQSIHFSEIVPQDGYDPVGNLLAKTRQDIYRTTTCAYTYDPLYQLRSETITGFEAQDYLYDSLYNRRLRNNSAHTINHLNQLLHVDETTYTYDKRGNLIAEESPNASSRYRYDALGRLTSLCRNGQQYTYQYDAFNRRIKKIGPDFEERYLYMDQKEVGKIDTQGKITQLRILGHGKGAEIGAIALELDDRIYIPIHDHAGNFAVLIDLRTHALAEGYVYTAFGEEQRYGTRTTNPWHFSSKRLDPESGWIYFGRRYYDPPTGRWTTPDPIGFADGPNLYAYVKNNPLTHFDAYGLLGAGTGGSSLYDMNRAQRGERNSRGNGNYSNTRSQKRGFLNSINAACSRACKDFAVDSYYDLKTSLSICSNSCDKISENIENSERDRADQLSCIKQQTEDHFHVEPDDRIYQRTHSIAGYGISVGVMFIPILGQEKAGAAIAAKILPRILRSAEKGARIFRRIFGNEPSTINQDKSQFRFPENPDDLLPYLPRDDKGRICPSQRIRIRSERHEIEPGEIYCPRHHDQHYHIEILRDPSKSWKNKNIEILKPSGYEPGSGTGFLPGELFPGM